MMRRLNFLLVFLLLILVACQKEPGKDKLLQEIEVEKSVYKKLEKIKQGDTLRAITSYSPTSYFIYRGQTMGYEYELLKRLAKHLDMELDIIIANSVPEMIGALYKGKGDIIAYGLTVTKQRKDFLQFTEAHTTTHQALVQRKPQNWRKMKLHEIERQIISDPIRLIDSTVHVRENSSYYDRLMNLNEEIGGGINITKAPDSLITTDLIRMVADGEIDYTVADYNIASINKAYYPILDISAPVSFNQRIAWAVRPEENEWLQEVDDWIISMRKKIDYHVIYNKYFKNPRGFKRRAGSDYYSLSGDKISPYDSLVKKYARNVNWDWRLLSSLIYHESHFDPRARSWVGARGLMQVMPQTGREMGYSKLFHPEQNIKAGTEYLNVLKRFWKSIPDSAERIKFIMASYNAGAFHVRDARRLTEKYGKDPNVWKDNVEYYLRMKSKPKFYNDEVVEYGYVRGIEPYRYVRRIMDTYKHYTNLIPDEPKKEMTAQQSR